MSLQLGEALPCGQFHEPLLNGLVRQAEGYVHVGTVLRQGMAAEKFGRIYGLVQRCGLLVVPPFRRFQSALLNEPLDHQPQDVHRKHRRGVVSRFALGVGVVVQHSRKVRRASLQQVVPHHNQGDSRRAQVLLRPGVDQPVTAEVYGFAEDVGRGVGNQRRRTRLRLVLPLGAEDGVVGGEVKIGCRGVQLQFVLPGNPGEPFSLGGTGQVDLPDRAGFL